jgi:hypothetical protein
MIVRTGKYGTGLWKLAEGSKYNSADGCHCLARFHQDLFPNVIPTFFQIKERGFLNAIM